MKLNRFLTLLVHFIIMSIPFSVFSQEKENIHGIYGPYLGQRPPGKSPEVFAQGIITETDYRLHGFPSFSNDGNLTVFSIIPPAILISENTVNGWTNPKKLEIPGRSINAGNISGDARRIYFQALMDEGHGSLDIWYIQKTVEGWSDPINIESPVNTSKFEGQPSLTKDGTIYYVSSLEGSGWGRGIYRSKKVHDRYQKPVLLNENINTEYIDMYPCISPDGTFLLFSSSRPSMDEENLRIYVSFLSGDDVWSKPLNLNLHMEFDRSSRFPYISPDGKYMFFQSNSKIYWIDAEIIENIRPDNKNMSGNRQ